MVLGFARDPEIRTHPRHGQAGRRMARGVCPALLLPGRKEFTVIPVIVMACGPDLPGGCP